mgnify:CR=1 FL=1
MDFKFLMNLPLFSLTSQGKVVYNKKVETLF